MYPVQSNSSGKIYDRNPNLNVPVTKLALTHTPGNKPIYLANFTVLTCTDNQTS